MMSVLSLVLPIPLDMVVVLNRELDNGWLRLQALEVRQKLAICLNVAH
jgi:hypothetical protein